MVRSCFSSIRSSRRMMRLKNIRNLRANNAVAPPPAEVLT